LSEGGLEKGVQSWQHRDAYVKVLHPSIPHLLRDLDPLVSAEMMGPSSSQLNVDDTIAGVPAKSVARRSRAANTPRIATAARGDRRRMRNRSLVTAM